MAEIYDVVSFTIVPYLIHFGKKGISPEVLDVEGGVIGLRKVAGKRLGYFLERADLDASKLVYGKLGKNLAYISKYYISHNDLHVFNVVVENMNRPVIIDWEKASDMIICGDHTDLIEDTGEHLHMLGKYDIFGIIEKEFRKEFEKEIEIPKDVSDEEIQKIAEEFMNLPAKN